MDPDHVAGRPGGAPPPSPIRHPTLDLSALGREASRLYVSADGYASTWAPLEVHDCRAVHGLRDTRWVDWVLIHSGIATTVTEVGTTIGRRSLDALRIATLWSY